MEVSGQLHAPAALTARKQTLVLIGWEMRWVQSRRTEQWTLSSILTLKILKWILIEGRARARARASTGFIWFTGRGGSCKHGNSSSDFYKRQRISYAVERPSAPQERFRSMELVGCLKCMVSSKRKWQMLQLYGRMQHACTNICSCSFHDFSSAIDIER
jgi:hypothetical protein